MRNHLTCALSIYPGADMNFSLCLLEQGQLVKCSNKRMRKHRDRTGMHIKSGDII